MKKNSNKTKKNSNKTKKNCNKMEKPEKLISSVVIMFSSDNTS